MFAKKRGPELKVVQRKGHSWSVYNYSYMCWYTDKIWTNKRMAKKWLKKLR